MQIDFTEKELVTLVDALTIYDEQLFSPAARALVRKVVERRSVTPDYCYDPDHWDTSYNWDDRDLIVESEWSVSEPKRIATLLEGPDKWIVSVPIDWCDGEPDDWQIQWFDTRDEALAALKKVKAVKESPAVVKG